MVRQRLGERPLDAVGRHHRSVRPDAKALDGCLHKLGAVACDDAEAVADRVAERAGLIGDDDVPCVLLRAIAVEPPRRDKARRRGLRGWRGWHCRRRVGNRRLGGRYGRRI
jgi:hypothetical protein